MKTGLRLTVISLMLINTACSTVIEGRSQKIAVDTFPSGADCVIRDNDVVLARVHTPGIATVEKSKNDILVECAKEGYISNKKRNRADIAITSMGNMAFGQWSFLGNAVDSASGASHKYDSKVFIALNELPPVAREGGLTTPAPDDSEQIAPQDWANLPPEQLARQLSQVLSTQKVIVTHEAPEEVIRRLMNNEPVVGAEQHVASLSEQDFVSAYHSAE